MATPVTLRTLQNRYEKQEPISVITAYDATFARLVDEAGIDAILVGDSLGNVIQGHRTTIPVPAPSPSPRPTQNFPAQRDRLAGAAAGARSGHKPTLLRSRQAGRLF